MQLRSLERQLGHPLFDRVGKRLVLTEAGQIAPAYADTVFAAGDELVSTLHGRPFARRQVLKVGALNKRTARPGSRPLRRSRGRRA